MARPHLVLLDMLAAVARKDYEQRRRRKAEGQLRPKVAGRYQGRAEDMARNAGIARMPAAGIASSLITTTTGARRATVTKVARRIRAKEQAVPAPG